MALRVELEAEEAQEAKDGLPRRSRQIVEVRRSDTLPMPSRLWGEISSRSGEARLPQQHAPARAERRPVLLMLAAAHRVAPVSQEAHGHDEDRVRREPAGVRPLERALVEQTLDEQHQRHQHRQRRAPDGGNAQLQALPAPSKAQGRRELRTAQGTEAAWDACALPTWRRTAPASAARPPDRGGPARRSWRRARARTHPRARRTRVRPTA